MTFPTGAPGLRPARLGNLRQAVRAVVRNRAFAIFTTLAVVLGGNAMPLAAYAVHDTGQFELDGNLVHDATTVPPYDWQPGPVGSATAGGGLFHTDGSQATQPQFNPDGTLTGASGSLLASTWIDDSPVPDNSYFNQNGAGVKDTDAIANWGCKQQSTPTPKDNLQHAYAGLFQIPNNGSPEAGDKVLYLGSDRQASGNTTGTNGDSFAGFWLFKQGVSCSLTGATPGAFTGTHTDGDILVVANFTNGGSVPGPVIYQWQGGPNGGPVLLYTGSLCGSAVTPSNPDLACNIANSASIPGWTTGINPIPANAFVEAGIDLSKIPGLGSGCFTNFLAETRSSQQIGATLKDYAAGQFDTCSAPPITTAIQPSSTITIGSSVYDTAAFTPPAPTAGGTVTYTVYNGTGCANGVPTGTPVSPAYSSTVTVTNGVIPNSAPFTPSAAGSYQFIANYSGDTSSGGQHLPSVSACGSEPLLVKAAPTIVTQASATVVVGGTISDTATLAAGLNPTGTITFTVFGPNNATCTGTPAFTSTVTVNGNGNYSSGSFTTTAVGTYRFVAVYSGDTNNNGVTSPCNATNESVVVNPAGPTIVTQASAPVVVGGTINDTATLSGGVNPTGTITFTVFGPDNATCTGAPAFTSTVTVSGNGSYPSGSFTTTAAGTYRFVASYSGDANNTAAVSPCNSANESVAVSLSPPIIVTHASAPVVVGGSISDTATLSLGYNPTGTITFRAFGPDDATCAGTAVFTSVVTVNGNGTYASGSFTPGAAGTYLFTATYSGDANNDPASDPCGAANESVVVSPAAPTIVTHASAPVVVGGTISDTATLSSGYNPTGTITFTVFGPNDATCTGTPAFTSTVTVNGNGNYSSGSFTTTAAGTYRFVAVYSGDANNNAVTSPCNAANESVLVGPAGPAITTQASVPVFVGGTISDTATLSGGFNPTGTITFTVFGPNNATCTGTPAFTSSVTVSGDGNYPSGSFTTTAAGTYRFVAVYSGDANNNAVTSACNAANESVVVSPAAPTVVTHASGTVVVGGTISDTATLAGGYNPTGTITFTVFGPNNTTCTGTPAFTSSVSVNGNGDYPSGSFTTTAVGTYRFVASYSGDANNNSVISPCNADNESVVVSPAAPTVVTHASGTVVIGGSVSDTATLAGGYNPTGTITFTVFGPNNATCTGTPVFTSTVSVNGNGNYTSGSFTPPSPGTYGFVADYSGDANNLPFVSPCGADNESVLVSTPISNLHKQERDVTTNGSFTDGPITANPGDTLQYQLVYTNTGNASATNVTVTDVVPTAHATLVAGSCTPTLACSYDAATHTLTWSLGTVAPGANNAVTMTFEIKLDAVFPNGTTQVSNAAVVTTHEEHGTIPSNTVVANINAAPISALHKQERDVSANGTFSDGPITAKPADILEYQLTYTNSGNAPATSVVITDPIPAHSSFLSCSNGCTNTATTVSWDLGTVPPGTVVLTFQVTLASDFLPGTTTNITNVATVTTAEQGTSPSNEVVATVTVAQAVLAVTIQLPKAGAGPGAGTLGGGQPLFLALFAALILVLATVAWQVRARDSEE